MNECGFYLAKHFTAYLDKWINFQISKISKFLCFIGIWVNNNNNKNADNWKNRLMSIASWLESFTRKLEILCHHTLSLLKMSTRMQTNFLHPVMISPRPSDDTYTSSPQQPSLVVRQKKEVIDLLSLLQPWHWIIIIIWPHVGNLVQYRSTIDHHPSIHPSVPVTINHRSLGKL